MKNLKYYLIGALFFVAAIIGYHFFAASQAEQQINEAIQEQAGQTDAISVQYSKIDIAPFSADITISDLNVIFGDHIERAQQLKLDIGYLDFLNIYFWGAEHALKQLETATLTVLTASYINRKKRHEFKTDTLRIQYTGNAYDGLNNAINSISFTTQHTLEVESSNVTLSMPETYLSSIKAQSLHYSGNATKGDTNFWRNGTHHAQLDSLNWTPPKSFQQKYSFFIKGFGYATDSIPFQHVEFGYKPVTNDTLSVSGRLKSELALLTISGQLEVSDPFSSSRFSQTQLTVSDFSDQFSNVLNNLEQLLGIPLSKQEGTITLDFSGSVSSPKITP